MIIITIKLKKIVLLSFSICYSYVIFQCFRNISTSLSLSEEEITYIDTTHLLCP